MIDTLRFSLKKLKATKKNARSQDLPYAQSARNDQKKGKYAVLTLHRPANVDNKEKLEDILRAIARVSEDMPIYFPCHPRTARNLKKFKLRGWLDRSNIRLLAPQSYLNFLAIWKDATLVLTDSGGIQEETTVLGIPCFTIRDNTERPVTTREGTNILVGTSGKGIWKEYKKFRSGDVKKGHVPEYWDGKTASRIIRFLLINPS